MPNVFICFPPVPMLQYNLFSYNFQYPMTKFSSRWTGERNGGFMSAGRRQNFFTQQGSGYRFLTWNRYPLLNFTIQWTIPPYVKAPLFSCRCSIFLSVILCLGGNRSDVVCCIAAENLSPVTAVLLFSSELLQVKYLETSYLTIRNFTG